MKRKVKYDLTFKLNFVKEILKDHRSVNLSSREGFDESLLRKWRLAITNFKPRK